MPVFSLGLHVDRDANGQWVLLADWLDVAIRGFSFEECYWIALKTYNAKRK